MTSGAAFHIALHVLVPLTVALIASTRLPDRRFGYLFGMMMLGMVIDLDHLLATPIFDPDRCSIGFHPLHSVVPIVVYVAFLIVPKLRWLGAGLCIHIALDALDCIW